MFLHLILHMVQAAALVLYSSVYRILRYKLKMNKGTATVF